MQSTAATGLMAKLKNRFSHLSRRNVLAILVALLFVPFPTELVPAWKMQFSDEVGRPLSRVRVNQSWKSYTYFAVSGYEERCSDSDGSVSFPTRYLWSSPIGRLVSPPLAEVLTLAHGSTGTSSNIQVFDQHYISDNYYWWDGVSTDTQGPPPTEGVAKTTNVDRGIAPCD